MEGTMHFTPLRLLSTAIVDVDGERWFVIQGINDGAVDCAFGLPLAEAKDLAALIGDLSDKAETEGVG